MRNNSNLHGAKKAKIDEFYTCLTDIEKELVHYKAQFQGKVVFCNCDDPEYSDFWRFFSRRFNQFGLRKLIATHYEENKPSYMLSMERVGNETPTVIKSLKGNGDFRSDECVELLKEADIVVTNPPFSLFREYVAQLMEYGKEFVIIGNINALTYKEFFPLIKENKVWTGYTLNGTGQHWFRIPDWYNHGKIKVENNIRYATIGGVIWFTNLDVKKHHEDLILYKHYSPEEYPKYDNYDAINVNRVAEIPCDYDGVMGVPITFLDKHNPDQFEIIGVINHGSDGPWDLAKCVINGKEKFKRIAIRRKKVQQDGN